MTINVETITEEESHWDLLIKDVQQHHGGTYLCQVTASKLYTHYVSLHVLGLYLIFILMAIVVSNIWVDNENKTVTTNMK